ncbi:MAG: sugar-transfer associated ATP-grasp domain-containing protein, partial [Alphaproteobacteria bacterium]
PMELAREYWRLHRGRGRLTLPEYVQYGVYDTSIYDPDQQARFITNTLHWPITRLCCDMTWQATTEDKWLCGHILERSDIRIPQTLAVIDRSDRIYPGTHHIADADTLRDFMTTPGTLPLFGKVNRIICGFGAFLAEAADDRSIYLRGHAPMSYETFLGQFAGDTPYLLQRLETNHPWFDKFTESLATIRVCVLLGAEGVSLPFAVLKLPARGNLVDSFWKPGNLACHVDVTTGTVLKARSKERLCTTDHACHPETGNRIVGETVPMWERVVDLAKNCAPIFRPLRY